MAAATATNDRLWQNIRAEAQRVCESDPVFSKSLADAVLAHDSFAAALADLIGRRLGGNAAGQARFTAFSIDAFRGAPELIEAAGRDLQAIVLRDPAVAGLLPPLLHFKGYVALQAWRVSHRLWRHDQRDAALLFQNEAANVLQVSIHPAASIGSSVYLDHATGIVIGANVLIGDDVTILQNVSIGRGSELPTRSPRIGCGVFIGAGATILGDIRIGDFARIGADTVVTSDVPGGCTAVGNPARLTNCPAPASAA
ncbi:MULTISPECIES: serine O-acetyltransferase [Bradyrhizobium]|jgi:serine O-acetyltransferase|uniref:Serine acetyltransferase n=1 Tax=Bradyrhizobium ottawaense TaxID=931866 RepID=A0A2U8P8L4_9BRAD|nr:MULTISPECIES: serine acetyltransferase [Bradyrhizobium]AWL94073.1 serine acetyltransferase [Bradyrhizobium ottawaense]MBR1290503.1 serine acetyltransferase [Bradyrhizobium ottawaense]MBR1327450.1 serine acetyltransferase [Bradyrhizobium ottawaense]MBR1336163.1 serine acetyltransferase [Bradyrhizobium ottawaense]MBR1360556.1 serine acetyltransferase [Bradyrhizobium ottawaense]